jgi:hypothetical protein
LGPPLKHFPEKFPLASARIIAVHFNVSHSTVKDILSREFGLRTFFRRLGPHQLSDPQKTFRIDTSVELLALLDQYFEMQFEGIATSDESWVCYLIESDAVVRKGFQGSDQEFRTKNSDYDVFRNTAVHCPG